MDEQSNANAAQAKMFARAAGKILICSKRGALVRGLSFVRRNDHMVEVPLIEVPLIEVPLIEVPCRRKDVL